MTLQSPVTQTLYAQLQEEASVFHAIIFEQGIAGSAYLNHANGHAYWYWQVTEPDGKLRRLSLGRDTPKPGSGRAPESAQGRPARRLRAQSATRAFVASGGMSMEAAHFRVMEHLARAGLFRKGLVLVGSHAFTALGNLLGLRWGSQLKTSDMDFARALGISLALPGNAEPLDAGRRPGTRPELFRRAAARQPAALNRHHQPQDAHQARFPDHHAAKETDSPAIPRPRHRRHPLRYMDYLLGGDNRRGLVVGSYAFPINLPDPARFAIHKLVIAQARRSETEAVARTSGRPTNCWPACSNSGWKMKRLPPWQRYPAGYPAALALVRRSQHRLEQSGDWLGQQLDRLAA
jgi:hypothetical protein